MIDPGSLPGQTASLDFGEQTQFDQERKAVESMGSPTASPAQAAQRAGQPGAEPGQPSAPPAVQPAAPPPRQPLQQGDMAPGGKVFSDHQYVPNRGWRRELKILAAHPLAGPVLGALAKKTTDEEAQFGKMTTPVAPPNMAPPAPGKPQ